MTVEDGSFSGEKIVDGIHVMVAVPSNHPYCHFCRNRVPAAVVLHRGDGNPLHICRDCLSARISALDTATEVTNVTPGLVVSDGNPHT